MDTFLNFVIQRKFDGNFNSIIDRNFALLKLFKVAISTFLTVLNILFRYLKDISLNKLPESCNPNEYDFTVIFSELIHLADSSMPAHQDAMGNRARMQQNSDGIQFTRYDDNQYYSYAQDKSDFRRRSDNKM